MTSRRNIAIGVGVAGAVAATVLAFRRPGAELPVSIPGHPRGKYGPVWGSRQPPGLPSSARGCGAAKSADRWIEAFADREGLGRAFTRWAISLAQTESGRMMGRPANNFDARPQALRPPDTPRITAWGAYQWNAPAGHNARHLAPLGISGVVVPGGTSWRPWHDGPAREVARAISMYAQIWRWVRQKGGTEEDAARACRVWHAQSARGRDYLRAGRSGDFARAWAQVPGQLRRRIDRHHDGVIGQLAIDDFNAPAVDAGRYLAIGACCGWKTARHLAPA